LPAYIDVICPDCRGIAKFGFAVSRAVQRRDDYPFFEESKSFELVKPPYGRKEAIHYPGLSARIEQSELPDGYSPEMWNRQYFRLDYTQNGKNSAEGALSCPACAFQRKHKVKWPDEAYFQVEYRGKVLWAYDRQTAIKLLNYVESKERRKGIDYYIPTKTHRIPFRTVDRFLHKIPAHFLTKSAREKVSKKLRKKLSTK